VARNLRKVTFLPPAPPSGAGDDGGGGNGGNTDFLHLFDAFDTFKQPQSAADASAPAAGGVGGAGLDGDVWADEWQGLSDIFNGDGHFSGNGIKNLKVDGIKYPYLPGLSAFIRDIDDPHHLLPQSNGDDDK
jgi:hypothetical protein